MNRVLLIIIALSFVVTTQAQNRIVVSKSDFTLSVISSEGDTLFRCGVAYGKNPGNKRVLGDGKTPEGVFKVNMIHESSSWAHDFKDGKGLVPGAYGPYFLRLSVPGFYSIGIHGTCFPESIGTRATRGCVRCKNEDLTELIKYVSVGTEVRILPDHTL